MLSKKIIIRILINTLIGGLLIFIWFQFVNIHDIIQTLETVDLLKTLPVIFFIIFTAIIRSFRLKVLLSKVKDIPAKDLIFLNGVALMLNFLIPIRAGEIAKGIYLNQTYNLPLGKSLAWIFIDRFLDFVYIFIAAGILLLVVPTTLPSVFAIMLLALGSLFVAVTFIVAKYPHLARRIFKIAQKLLFFDKPKRLFEKGYEFFLDTTSILNLPAIKVMQIILLTIISYASDAFVWFFAFSALNTLVSYIQMYLAVMLSALTYLIPAAPGYVGSAEASGLLILSGIFGFNANLASAVIVLFHVCVVIAVLIYGIISVYGLKIDLSLLLKKALKRE